MDGGVFGFISIDIINIVIFSGDITLSILLINPFKDYVEAVFSPTGALFFSASHQYLTVSLHHSWKGI